MKNLTSKDGEWIAERLGSSDIQVSNVKTFTSYTILATKAGTLGRCPCSFSKRPGTECPHMALVKEFVAMEQAPVVVAKPVSALQAWLNEQADQGVMLFA